MFSLLGYQPYPAPTVTVQTIKVKMPAQVNYLLQESKKYFDMLVYFNRPNSLIHMKYVEMFRKYISAAKLPTRSSNNPAVYSNSLEGYFQMIIPGLAIPIYLSRRQRDDQIIVRMKMVRVTAGEIWFLRLLLLHRSSISFQDARTVNGVLYPSYQAAAVAANLVTDLIVAKECFDQNIGLSTPAVLRGLFATLTLNGYLTLCVYNDDRYKRLL